MLTLYLATLNDHKIDEVSKILAALSQESGSEDLSSPFRRRPQGGSLAKRQALAGSRLKTVAGLGLEGEWQETGLTFARNAQIKTEFVRDHLLNLSHSQQDKEGEAARLDGPIGILGEDSGICVAALGNGPGIHSKRYSGVEGARQDAANNEKLLAALAHTDDRRAYYHCSLSYWQEDIGFVAVDGHVHGTIASEPRGEGGFGYDPLFIPQGESKTFGQLGEQYKLTLSHRYDALAKWLDLMATI